MATTDNAVPVAVIGAGWYGAQNHIPVLAGRADVRLDGVCRLGAAELERVRAHFGFAFASEDYRALLARRPRAVVVSTPHHLHYAQTRDAIASGAHVLCEKPMTLVAAEAWDLVARARQAGVQLLIANGHQYLGGVSDVRRMIRDGAVGRVEHILCSFVSATRAVFDGDVGLQSWKTTFFPPDHQSTWQAPEHGGGFAYGQLSHSLAMMLWLTGLKPAAVSAQCWGPGKIDLVDAGALLFEGGAVASLSGAAAMPEGQRPFFRLVVTGSAGVLDIAFDSDHCELRRHDGANRRLAIAPGQWAYRCDGPIQALIDLACGRGENCSPGEVGAATVSIIEAMLRSSKAGGRSERVEIPTGERLP